MPLSNSARTRRQTWLRVRAVLAGGLVLGVGTAVTLASWNDAEYASGNLQAGTFGVVGSIDGSTFTDHAAAPGAALTFSVPATAAAMVPGSVVYSRFAVKTTDMSVAGNLKLDAQVTNAAAGTLGVYLTYGAKLLPASATTCDATTYAAATAVAVADGSPLTASDATTRALSAKGTNTLNYCFAIALPLTADNAAQGKTLTATWQFIATT